MIEIEYIVKDSKGAEQLRTTDKKAAEAYDKALDNAERLQELLRHDKVLPNLSESDLEELTIYLALNAKNVDRILKGKAPELSGSEDNSPKSANVAPIKTAKE
jgi:dsDNA-binding SOS-regulon protein